LFAFGRGNRFDRVDWRYVQAGFVVGARGARRPGRKAEVPGQPAAQLRACRRARPSSRSSTPTCSCPRRWSRASRRRHRRPPSWRSSPTGAARSACCQRSSCRAVLTSTRRRRSQTAQFCCQRPSSESGTRSRESCGSILESRATWRQTMTGGGAAPTGLKLLFKRSQSTLFFAHSHLHSHQLRTLTQVVCVRRCVRGAVRGAV
jgi:hypothetical protein